MMNHRGWRESGSRVTSSQTVLTTPLGYAYYRQKDGSTDIELRAYRLRYADDKAKPLDLGYWTMSDKAFTGLHTFSIAFNSLFGDEGKPKIVLDGATACNWTDGNYRAVPSTTCNYFNNQAANIGVAAIRVYNRPLTAGETAANAAIDRARFFGDKASAAYESTPAFGEIPPAGLMLILR